MNTIEITIDGSDIIMDGHRLDLAAAEGLRDILDHAIRRINDAAREHNEREQAAQRERDIERVRSSALATFAGRAGEVVLRADGEVRWMVEELGQGKPPRGAWADVALLCRDLAGKVPERRLWWVATERRAVSHLDGCGCYVPVRSVRTARIMPADWRPERVCSRSVKRLAGQS